MRSGSLPKFIILSIFYRCKKQQYSNWLKLNPCILMASFFSFEVINFGWQFHCHRLEVKKWKIFHFLKIFYLSKQCRPCWNATFCNIAFGYLLFAKVPIYGSQVYKGLNPLLHDNAFWRLWNTMYLEILWKIEHLLHWRKCSIFHNIFKSIQNFT